MYYVQLGPACSLPLHVWGIFISLGRIDRPMTAREPDPHRRPSLRKGALGDVIALTSLDILSECSHLCRDSRWCLNGEKYLVL